MSKVFLTTYFDIQATLQDDKINFEMSSKQIKTAMPFLGRSSNNNAVVDYVTPREDKINKGGVISLALDGSTGSTFYQHHDFCSGQNIWKLVPKKEKFCTFNPLIAMYCITSIRKAVQNYSYNLGLTKTRLYNVKFILPLLNDNTVDINKIEKIMANVRNINLLKSIPRERI